MLDSLSNYITVKGQKARWKKVSELKKGMKIAVSDSSPESGIFFDEILSIKKLGRERVYDIEVKSTHNFIANSILAHNTYIESGNLGIGTTNPTGLLQIGIGATTPLIVTTAGNVGVGTTGPGYKFQVVIDESNEGHVDSVGAWARSSDIKYKTNIIDLENTLPKLLGLRPIRYDSLSGSKNHIGLIAQDVSKIFPEFISQNSTTGTLGLSYESFTPVLIKAIQEQNIKLDSLYNGYSPSPTPSSTPAASPTDNIIQNLLARGRAVFEGIVEFIADVTFKGRITFEDKDIAGFAIIAKDQRKVNIVFEKEFSEAPVVTASFVWDIPESTVSVVEQLNGFFIPSDKYTIAGLTKKGFSIILDNKAVSDLKFSWTAIPVKNAKTYKNESESPKTTSIPTSSPTPVQTINLGVSTSPSATPSQAPTTSPSPITSPTETPIASPSQTPQTE